MRKKLIEEVRSKGINSEQVLEALMRVPRHFFLDQAFLKQAYTDQAYQIGAGQTISQPYTVAYQTSLLELVKGDKVLEIGTGSGYQTCVLNEMGAKVFSVERQKELYEKTKVLLQNLKNTAVRSTAKLFYGDGYRGLPSFAPFDKILVTCGAPYVPPDLISQLKIGGILIIPLSIGETQMMTKIIKTGDTIFDKQELKRFRFVPMLENKND